jgi:predicted nucleic acid-binding Zn ribbon protein
MTARSITPGEERRRRVRRSVLLWSLVAAAFYVGFIVMAVVHGSK